jgi:hypothetical protein
MRAIRAEPHAGSTARMGTSRRSSLALCSTRATSAAAAARATSASAGSPATTRALAAASAASKTRS